LFGLSAAPHRVHATFWLLDAPDSLSRQSRKEPDGTGLGTFAADGTPHVDKEPLAAYQDQTFAREAKERVSTTFLAHIRYASTGGLVPANTHPFEQRGSHRGPARAGGRTRRAPRPRPRRHRLGAVLRPDHPARRHQRR
jgi:predicted glutamine amidotransferase